jgi:hypothetical protein
VTVLQEYTIGAIVGQGLLMIALLPLIDRSINGANESCRAFRRKGPVESPGKAANKAR